MTKRLAVTALALGAAAVLAAPAAPASAGCSPTVVDCIEDIRDMLVGPICICE